MADGWYVYIAECKDNTYYTGVTDSITDVRGSSVYVQNRKLKAVPWCRRVESKASALLIQTHIRGLKRELKEYIIYNELDCDAVLNFMKRVR